MNATDEQIAVVDVDDCPKLEAVNIALERVHRAETDAEMFDPLCDLFDAGYESAREKWTAFDWDDASKQPSELGWYLCRDLYPGESQPVVCDEWNGSEFVHYGVYGAWMPIPDFKEANDDQ